MSDEPKSRFKIGDDVWITEPKTHNRPGKSKMNETPNPKFQIGDPVWTVNHDPGLVLECVITRIPFATLEYECESPFFYRNFIVPEKELFRTETEASEFLEKISPDMGEELHIPPDTVAEEVRELVTKLAKEGHKKNDG